MLQIGVDHGGIGRPRGQDALDAGAGQSAPPDPADTADAGILPRQAPHHFPGAVGGIVVEEHDFPGNTLQRRIQPPVQHRDVVALVEGGDDDRKLGQTGGLRWVVEARFDGVIHGASVYPQPPALPRQGSGTGADRWKKQAKTGPNMPTTTNRRARVHPALPGYSWSSQRRSFLSVDVAVRS